MGVLIGSCLLSGCEGGGGAGPSEGTATPENPQAGLDAMKKLQGGAKPTSKGMVTPAEETKK